VVEMTGGGWSPAPHVRAAELRERRHAQGLPLRDRVPRPRDRRAQLLGKPARSGRLGEKHREDTEDTIRLAGELGVKKIVMMSGLPPAAPGDRIPNWITYTVSWPATLQDALNYQWNDVAIPYWEGLVRLADEIGVEACRSTDWPHIGRSTPRRPS